MSKRPMIASLLLAGLLATATANAQHTPLIERMADASATSSPTPPATPTDAVFAPAANTAPLTSAPYRPQIGDTTRALLRMQADGSNAGNALPMLGETATRSYQRYLNSFDHPIPEYFEGALPNSKQGGSSR
ncbi:DUF3613 domain-containing protein [Stenotrophomonas sp. Iso1]|uniref:DUF3613 domain-containing protein n=1 Tax=Stenotrophomonas sp. Iso1 TaxID=2977283 RepID=UPI0022B7C68F|nr:DUF3613 domain-containing protein [Stenotrophomonas sp. Iso1]